MSLRTARFIAAIACMLALLQSAPAQDDAHAKAARDYELAERVGTKAAWDAFLAAHPKGFHADLARAQVAKLGAAAPSTAPAKPSAAPPAPLPADLLRLILPVDANVLRLIETDPMFADAPPVSAASYRLDTLTHAPETWTTISKVAVRAIRPGLVRFDDEQVWKHGTTPNATISVLHATRTFPPPPSAQARP